MDLLQARRWLNQAGIPEDEQAPVLLAAGLAAGFDDLSTPFVGSLDPRPDLGARPIIPIRMWRDPTASDVAPPSPGQARDLLIPNDGVRLSFEAETDPNLVSLIRDWLRPLTWPVAISFSEPVKPNLRPWSLPVRLAIAPEFRQPLLHEAGDWLEPLVTFVNPRRRRSNPQLTVGSADWIASWQEQATTAVGASVVLGSGPPSSSDNSAGIDQVGARIYLAESSDVVRITSGLLYHLSHNRSLDEAAHLAAEDQPIVVIASPAYLDRTRITDVIKMASARQARMRSIDSFDWTGDRAPVRNINPSRSAGTTRNDVADIIDDFQARRFDHETHDAAEAADRIRDIEARSADREHRFLTADVHWAPPDRQGAGSDADFAATLDLWIAPLRLAGSAIAQERLPEESFDWSAGDVELDVVLFELRDGGLAQRSTVTLPAAGESDRATFYLRWSHGDFEARVAVLYRHRFVQTMLVTVDEGGSSLRFEAECVVRSADFELHELEPHNAAIVLNDHDGPKIAIATSNGQEIRAPQGLDELRQSMTNLLLRIIDEPEEFESTDSPAFSKLLCDLALRGATLRDVLFTGEVTAVARELYNDLRTAKRISILSAEPTKVLPLEFVYDPEFKPPFGEVGAVCEQATEALRSGQDLAQLLPSCGHLSDTGTCGADETKVCPLGFWGFRTVIERHAKRPEGGSVGMDFSLGASPTTERSALNVSAVLASATPKADANPTDAWSTAKAEMSELLAERFESVEGWLPIVNDFKNEGTSRDVLLLLPHVDKDNDGELLLDLGIEPSMGVHQITGALEMKSDRPLVMLLGCATGPSETPTMEFPGRFLDAGAAVVLATMTLVRGRFVSALGQQLITLINGLARSEEQPLFGEALLQLRQKLLGQNPLVLTLIAYGDADWVLAAGDEQ